MSVANAVRFDALADPRPGADMVDSMGTLTDEQRASLSYAAGMLAGLVMESRADVEAHMETLTAPNRYALRQAVAALIAGCDRADRVEAAQWAAEQYARATPAPDRTDPFHNDGGYAAD